MSSHLSFILVCIVKNIIYVENAETFEAALAHCNRLREKMPAVYNRARLHEHPIPPTTFVTHQEMHANDNNNVSLQTSASSLERNEDLDSTWFDSAESQNLEPVHVYLEQNSNGRQQANLQPTLNISGELANLDQVDIKPVIALNGEELVAFENLFNESAISDESDPLALTNVEFESTRNSAIENAVQNAVVVEPSRSNDENDEALSHDDLDQNDVAEQQSFANHENNNKSPEKSSNNDTDKNDAKKEEERQRRIELNLQTVLLFGAKCVVDADLEYIHLPNQNLRPFDYISEYQVKTEDVLCGNKPFKQHVCFIVFKQNNYENILSIQLKKI